MKKRGAKKSGKAKRRPKDLTVSKKAGASTRGGTLARASSTSGIVASGATKSPNLLGGISAIDPYAAFSTEF